MEYIFRGGGESTGNETLRMLFFEFFILINNIYGSTYNVNNKLFREGIF